MILPQALPNFSSSTDLRCQCRHPLPRAAQACQPRWLLRCLFSLVPCTWRRVVGFYIHLQLHVTLQSLFQGTSARQTIFYYIRSYYHIILYCIISYHIILDHKDRGSNCLGHHEAPCAWFARISISLVASCAGIRPQRSARAYETVATRKVFLSLFKSFQSFEEVLN